MTSHQRRQTIDLIRKHPQSLGALQIRHAVGAGLEEVAAFLRRGEDAGFLSYVDEGPGFRGYVIVRDWEGAA